MLAMVSKPSKIIF